MKEGTRRDAQDKSNDFAPKKQSSAADGPRKENTQKKTHTRMVPRVPNGKKNGCSFVLPFCGPGPTQRMKERGLLAQAILSLSATNGLLIATTGIPVAMAVWTCNTSPFTEKHGKHRSATRTEKQMACAHLQVAQWSSFSPCWHVRFQCNRAGCHLHYRGGLHRRRLADTTSSSIGLETLKPCVFPFFLL